MWCCCWSYLSYEGAWSRPHVLVRVLEGRGPGLGVRVGPIWLDERGVRLLWHLQGYEREGTSTRQDFKLGCHVVLPYLLVGRGRQQRRPPWITYWSGHWPGVSLHIANTDLAKVRTLYISVQPFSKHRNFQLPQFCGAPLSSRRRHRLNSFDLGEL